MTIYTMLNIPPPVWPSSLRVNDGKNNIHMLLKICTRQNTLFVNNSNSNISNIERFSHT